MKENFISVETLVYKAAKNGNYKDFITLIENHNGNVNTYKPSKNNKKTVLYNAVYNSFSYSVKDNPQHQQQYHKIIEYILSKTTKDPEFYGTNAFGLAVRNCSPEIVELFFKSGKKCSDAIILEERGNFLEAALSHDNKYKFCKLVKLISSKELVNLYNLMKEENKIKFSGFTDDQYNNLLKQTDTVQENDQQILNYEIIEHITFKQTIGSSEIENTDHDGTIN